MCPLVNLCGTPSASSVKRRNELNTVQLSSKVTFAHVSDASHTRSGCTPVWRKRGMELTYVLLQLYHEVLRLHGRVSRASQKPPARVSDAFERYLGAELYCISLALKLAMVKVFHLPSNRKINIQSSF